MRRVFEDRSAFEVLRGRRGVAVTLARSALATIRTVSTLASAAAPAAPAALAPGNLGRRAFGGGVRLEARCLGAVVRSGHLG
jgi:hypothetical protein